MKEELLNLLEEHESGAKTSKTRNKMELVLENKGFEFNKNDYTYTNSNLECYAWLNDEPLYFQAKDEKSLKRLRKTINNTEDVNYIPARLGLGLTAATGMSVLGLALMNKYAPEIYYTIQGTTRDTTQIFAILGLGAIASLLGATIPAKHYTELQDNIMKPKLFRQLQDADTRYITGYTDILREMLHNES